MSLDAASNVPVFVELAVRRGTTWVRTIQINEDGAPVDYLDGYTARMQVRPSAASETLILELTTENGGIAINAELGQIGLRIEEDDTVDLRKGVYDLELIAPSGEVISLMTGTFRVSLEVTR